MSHSSDDNARKFFAVVGVNPEPWEMPPIGVGRSKSGKVHPVVGRANTLHNYKQALAEEVAAQSPPLYEGAVDLHFWFWRDSAYGNQADGTNLSKATEDALQGVLYRNDHQVRKAKWEIVEQAPGIRPRIVIAIKRYVPRDLGLPSAIETMLASSDETTPKYTPRRIDSSVF